MHRTLTVALFALLLALVPMAGVGGATAQTTADTQALDSVQFADAASAETALNHPANVTITN